MSCHKSPLIISNWKMNKTVQECLSYLAYLTGEIENRDRQLEIVLCVPFVVLKTMADRINDPSPISISGQDVHWEEWGAYTGEISAPMLKDVGAKYCMIGHSERRKYFGETDEKVNKRALSLLKSGIKPIICIGETVEERALDLTNNILERQLRVCLNRLSSTDLEKTCILYEPRWAIGTGAVASTDQIAEAHGYIRQELDRLFSRESASRTRITYGGSVTPQNIETILRIKDVDGVGVGAASLDPRNFLRIVNAVGAD